VPVPVIVQPEPAPLRKVALALDFSGNEVRLIEAALRFLGRRDRPDPAPLVESPSARVFGLNAADLEMGNDQSWIESYAVALRAWATRWRPAWEPGSAPELARLANEAGVSWYPRGHGHAASPT